MLACSRNVASAMPRVRLKAFCNLPGKTELSLILFDSIAASPGTNTSALRRRLLSSKFPLRYGNIKNLLVRTSAVTQLPPFVNTLSCQLVNWLKVRLRLCTSQPPEQWIWCFVEQGVNICPWKEELVDTHTSVRVHMQSEWAVLYTCEWGQSLSIPRLWYYDRL